MLQEFPGGPVVLGLRAFTAEGQGSIPGQGTKIPQESQPPQNTMLMYRESSIIGPWDMTQSPP